MITFLWHTFLDMPKHDRAWHEQDIADELQELKDAHGLVHVWSELSDVSYTYSRAQWTGHSISWPLKTYNYYIGLFYMYPKYSLRYLFFWLCGKCTKKGARLREVRNPRKVEKLHGIAEQYGLDPHHFERVAKSILKFWPLSP